MGGSDASSEDMTGRICSRCGDALARVPEQTLGLLLLSNGRESKKPNTGIRPVRYQRNVIPIVWGLAPNSED